jgi:nitrogen fixation/metabolism regulation signal transduction histidine kinase
VKQRFRTQFRVLTIVQVCLLAVTLCVLALTVLETNHLAVPLVLAGIAMLQVIALIRSVQAHVDSLEDFFAAVNYEDFTRRFIEDDIDAELKDAFNKVLERFQDARADRDLQAGYLDTVIRHVPVAFFAARSDGSLSLVNNPARRLTGMPTLQNISDLATIDETLPAALAGIEAGQQRLLQTNIRGLPVELRVSVAEIRMAGEVERLYSIENLSGELSARESSAWRNLIRVLTHEIMNTLTPITSLAQTTVEMLDDPDSAGDIREAIETIGRRSEGMIRFISRYRELLHVPDPKAEDVSVLELLQNVATLLRP